MCKGNWIHKVLAMHEKYGSVVRVAPDELSFISAEALKDIYGHRTGGELPKAVRLFRGTSKFPASLLITQDIESHRALRRRLAPGFSEQSMRLQEPCITSYVSLLLTRLLNICEGGKKEVDLLQWYNFTTFDMMGDLSFGEPFDCLRNSKYHTWVAALNGMARQGTYLVVLGNMGFEWLVTWLFTSGRLAKRNKNASLTREKLIRRMKATRHDLVAGLLKNDEKNPPLPMQTIQANSSMLMLGGSETTATLLCGITYLLLSYPKQYHKAVQEVRRTFANIEDITLMSVSKLDFMHACINESLRRYPPTAGSQPRFVPKGGAKIDNHFVPEGTVVSIYPYVASLCSENFTDSFEFHPERYLGDEKFSSDNFGASQPFSVGPRNCIGRTLTYAQSRLILARILFTFDMKLSKRSSNWMNQTNHVTWDKPPLYVHLTPVERAK
ncbi:isotrichodermin C-15 hydroxylase [Paramyrothecium foliicola]|nr:isotrichodermin C-15 hydroxylase [Paramyrothecium foliicola]